MKTKRKCLSVFYTAVVLTLIIAFGPIWSTGRAEDESLPELSEQQQDTSAVEDDSLRELENIVQGDNASDEAKALEDSRSVKETGNDLVINDTPPPTEPNLGSIETSPAPASIAAPPMLATVPTANAPKNEITNVEFKVENGVSRIIISTRRKMLFREIKNPSMKQVVYYFDNTTTSQRLQRAFDTTEFVSPVALFTVLQMPNEVPALSKLIVQLREDQPPTVNVSDRAIVVEFPAPTQNPEPKLVKADDEKKAVEENIYSGGQTYTGQSIARLEIKNSEVQDVLRLIAKSSGYNVVVGEDVQGKVGTLSLENVPWDQAFALVLQSKKLGYIRQGNVLRVGTLANLKSEKEEALANEQSRIRVEPLKTVLIPINYARVGDIVGRARALSSERGSVDTDDRTNTLILRDISAVIDRTQKLIAALDIQPPRVSISGKVVELSTTLSRDVGLNNITFNEDLAGINAEGRISTSATPGGTAVRIRAPRFASLAAELALGELNQQAKVLANPSLSVVANQAASISSTITLNVPVPAATATGATVATGGGYASFPATLSLAVTPIVAGDGSIFMNVAVSNDLVSIGQNGNVTQQARSMRTQVLVDNGDTAVIGGLFQNNYSTSKSGVAYLMRIPILGFLFGSSNLVDSTTEIFVFLTAKILNTEEAFRRNS